MHGWHTVLESRHVMVCVHVMLPLHPGLHQTHTPGLRQAKHWWDKPPNGTGERGNHARTAAHHVCMGGGEEPRPARITTTSTHHHNNDSTHNHADSGIGNSALAAASAACAQQR